ncbi:MAG: hypothetical protein RIC55_26890 [Pirellulaceae bacterium]
MTNPELNRDDSQLIETLSAEIVAHDATIDSQAMHARYAAWR